MAILVGTTIGAGIFGLPYTIARIGFLPGLFYLLILGGLILLLNLLYGEVILRTPGDHQLTGYGQVYLGKKGRHLATLALFISLYGALLAYLVKIGEFLALILNLPHHLVFSLLFFFLASMALFFGLKAVSQIELVLVILIIAFMSLIGLVGAKSVLGTNLSLVDLTLPSLTLPYGVLLFALTGTSSIPEMEEVLRQEPQKLKKAILLGTLIPILIYLFFLLLVVGISGLQTSEDAITGLLPFLSSWIVKLGAGLGVLTMGTSFLALGYVLREVWHRDFKLPKFTSLSLACLPPLILLLAGAKSFITILEITGALTGGLVGILIIFLHQKAKQAGSLEPAYQIKIPTAIYWLLTLVFLLGMLSPFF